MRRIEKTTTGTITVTDDAGMRVFNGDGDELCAVVLSKAAAINLARDLLNYARYRTD